MSVTLHCPSCGASAFEASEDIDLEKPFICGKCGASAYTKDLKTESGQTLQEYAVNLAREAFKGIKGFKPGR